MAMVFAFVLPLSKAGISLMMFLFLVLWLVEANFRQKYDHIINSKLSIAIILFFCFNLLSMIWTQDAATGWSNMRTLFYLFIIIIFSTSIKKQYINNIITAFLFGTILLEMMAYGVYFELWTIGGATTQDPTPFMNRIHYSVFMAVTSVLLLNRLFADKYSIKDKLIMGFFFFTVTVNLLLSSGRTGQLGFIAGIVIMFIIHYRVSIKSFVITTLFLSVLFITAYNTLDNFQKRVHDGVSDVNKMTQLNFNSSWGIRAIYWITTYKNIKENPSGSGVGDYKIATNKQIELLDKSYIDKDTKEFLQDSHPHNQYLKILLQGGIVGFLLFLFIIYNIFKLNIKDKELKELSILFATVYFTSCIAEPLLGLLSPLGLFIFFIGLFLAYENDDKKLAVI